MAMVEKDEDTLALENAVGASMAGLGALCLVVGIIWMVLRLQGIGNVDAYIGAEGMIVTSLLFIGIGLSQRNSGPVTAKE